MASPVRGIVLVANTSYGMRGRVVARPADRPWNPAVRPRQGARATTVRGWYDLGSTKSGGSKARAMFSHGTSLKLL